MAKRAKRKPLPPTTNSVTQSYRDFWEQRELLKCQGKSLDCRRGQSNHDKHLAKNLPEGFDDPCVLKQCHPRHRHDRLPENMGLADPHYTAEVTKTLRHPNKPGEDYCCHGDDYDTDSDDEDDPDDNLYINKFSKWMDGQLVDIKSYIPAIGAFFVLWMFVMNYAIYGKGPATTDR